MTTRRGFLATLIGSLGSMVGLKPAKTEPLVSLTPDVKPERDYTMQAQFYCDSYPITPEFEFERWIKESDGKWIMWSDGHIYTSTDRINWTEVPREEFEDTVTYTMATDADVKCVADALREYLNAIRG